ncbi:uncharacterized protein [Halyomorpha halys]|uniref:uncharacterized protein isoform X2 n=1 Tax=Halyomorpha halys TaxID=286706 RepID=UPI000D0C9029|nr:uncharacterized protein LOC106689686 isoform X2 [Halyomorpha halys]
MSYKDIIPQLGLPDDLNKRLEELLSMEKDKERKKEGTFHPGFKDLSAARKQFRKAYRKIRKHSPSKPSNRKQDSDSEEDLNLSISNSSDSQDSDLVDITDPDDMMNKLPSLLSDEQQKKIGKENEQLKYLENKYFEKKLQFDKALKELEEDDRVDEELLKSITSELDIEMEGYDYEADNEELDKIINELKEMTRESGKLEDLVGTD